MVVKLFAGTKFSVSVQISQKSRSLIPPKFNNYKKKIRANRQDQNHHMNPQSSHKIPIPLNE